MDCIVSNLLWSQAYTKILSAENQKDVNVVQQCSVENQKGAIAIHFV